MIRILLFFLAGAVLSSSCKNQKKVVYPEYSAVRNTVEILPHLNDSTLLVNDISTNPLYGRVPEKPIFLGVYSYREGGKNRSKFFRALAGPQGEEISAYRLKSCCPFKTLNSQTVGPDQKFGLLDIWIVNYDGGNPDTLYINPYDEGELIAPTGYKIKN